MLPSFAALCAFEAVARRRSFALAAAQLHLTPSAVSHQIAKLEALLNIRLFERGVRAVTLTPAGEAYLQRVGGAIGAIASATGDLRQGVRNSLYVHVSPSFASLWLMPRIGRFAKAHPDVSLFLSASHVHSDFAQGQVDMDIRYGHPNWPQLVVEPIFREPVLPLASPQFLQEHAIHNAADLLQLPLIQSTVSVVQWTDWLAKFGRPTGRAASAKAPSDPPRYALRFDRAMMALDAAVQGLGIALESSVIASSHIEAGRLQSVFAPRQAIAVQAHFLVYPKQQAQRPELMQFLDWLAQEAAAS